MHKIIPILEAIKKYSKSTLGSDAIAGITVGIILIPQAIAYALLMGMPAEYGLYACIFPLVIYAIFGTSRQLSIGPVAVTSILVISGVGQLAKPFTAEYIDLVIYVGLLVGLLQIMMSALRMGFLVNLISQPVISGFISAVAIIIIISQLEEAFGIAIPDFDSTFKTAWYSIIHISEANWITTVITFGSILIMVILKKWKKSFPSALLVLVVSTLLIYIFNWDEQGVAIIRDVPSGFPKFEIPKMNLETLQQLLPSVLTVTFIGYIGSIGIGKSLEMKNRDHIVRPNQELFALGMAKIIGAFFQAIPTSGSYSRSAINDEAGGKTTIATLFSVIILLISVVLLTPLFFYIPKSVLSAIILISVFNLINVKEAKYLLKLRRRDFVVMLITFVGTLVFGVEIGILIGVILSYIFLQFYSSLPHIAELVRIPDTSYYRNINRFPEAKQSEKYLIIRFDNQLYFGNTSYFKDAIIAYVDKREKRPDYLILQTSNVHDIDSTGIHVLEDIHSYLETLKIQLLITGTIGPVRDFLKRSGFTDRLGSEHYFMTITDAVEYAENKTNYNKTFEPAIQYNKRRSFLD